MVSKWAKDKNATSENVKLLEEQSVCGVPRDKIKIGKKKSHAKQRKEQAINKEKAYIYN